MPDLFEVLKNEPKFRQDQIYRAWFNPAILSYDQITTLPKNLRAELTNEPWLTVALGSMRVSKIDNTKKALLKLADGNCVETVLMGRENKKLTRSDEERYTICISTQVGCPMGCVFCATGKMGFKRNLTAREIIDEYRFWQQYLVNEESKKLDSSPHSGGIQNDKRISNIVLMGQGEPLLNYDNVKMALKLILKYTEIGERQITVSTVGVPAVMEKMVDDSEWPAVRFALSLHNPIEAERKKLIPSHQADFLLWLIDWSKKYHQRFSARTQFVGIEYTLVPGENDSERHLKTLIKLVSKLGRTRVNLIPLNTGGMDKNNLATPSRSPLPHRHTGLETGRDSKEDLDTIHHWQKTLMAAGFTTTIRRSQGQDIEAACGQLALKESQN